MSVLPAPPVGEADPVLDEMLSQFETCVCAELAAAGRAACACCLVWGDSPPPADFCDCDCPGGSGQAWVRVVRWESMVTSSAPARRCQPVRARLWLEAGVYRCVPAVGPDGSSGPECDDRRDSARGFLADARALRTAMACCMAFKGRVVEFMSQEPVAVRGGCAGVRLQFTVEV